MVEKIFRQYQKAGLYGQVAGSNPPVGRGMCPQQQSPLYQAAVGDSGGYADDRVWKEGKKGGL